MFVFFFQELDQRHNAVLQMYGEKAEECEELKMDLEDVKSMYKTQVQKLQSVVTLEWNNSINTEMITLAGTVKRWT